MMSAADMEGERTDSPGGSCAARRGSAPAINRRRCDKLPRRDAVGEPRPPPRVSGVILINLFEVPPDREEEFVSGWRRAREFLAAREGFRATTLHRSLAAQAEFRFVDLAHVKSVEAWGAAIGDPDFPGWEMPGTPHPGLYEIVREDETSDDATAGAVLINAFEVRPRDDDRFLTGWERAREALSGQDGYLGTRLHRSLTPETHFRFVNIADWSDPSAVLAALQRPEFQRASNSIPFPAHPALYEALAD
jgi:heme-degrading monooxygenase HmoA